MFNLVLINLSYIQIVLTHKFKPKLTEEIKLSKSKNRSCTLAKLSNSIIAQT